MPNKMRWSILSLAITCLVTPTFADAESVYFDVAHAPDHASSLPAIYTGDAASLVTATPLLAHNVSPSYDSDLGGPGDFIFTGWQVKEGPLDYSKYIEFSVTASSPISLDTLKYTAFGGNWSNMGGPRGIMVQASRDGFANNVTTVRYDGWNVIQTTPYITNSPNDFVDSLSSLGRLWSGQTMSFRFYMIYTDYGHIPGGLWNKDSLHDYNPTLGFTSVPEPSTFILIGIGAVSLLTYAWRKRQAA